MEEAKNFPSPMMKKELQSILSVAASIHMWNPNIAKITEQMRHLNKKGPHIKSEEQWTEALEEEFINLK